MKPIQHAACLCALSVLLALSPAVALCENPPAENQQAEDSQLQTSKQANLRKLPNTKSDKLETLKKHSVVTILSEMDVGDETWVYVRVAKSGREGYVLLSLLEPVPTPTPGDPGATGTPETPATEEATETIEDDATPRTAPEPIDDDGTPLASGAHRDCWVHWLMLLGILVTVVYYGGVGVRRVRFSSSLQSFEDDVLGNDETNR